MASKKPLGVVLTGGDFMALGVLRTFAHKNIPILMLEHEHSISRYSLFRKRVVKSPPPSEPEAYAHFMVELAKKEGISGWVVFPNSDEIVYVLSRYRDLLLPYYRIPTPDWNVIQNVYIKKNTYQLAKQLGIPIPATYFPQSLEEAAALDLPYPCVIKPSIRDHFYSRVKTKAYRVNTPDELVRIYRQVSAVIPPSEILIQDMIPGGPRELYSYCPFFKNGKSVAAIMARRSRQHPMDFGHASTFAELVDIPDLRYQAERFLEAIGYYGIAEVEFMRDPRDGINKMIEVNPRIWGWHALAIAAGVDLPHYLYQDMIGEIPQVGKPALDYKWFHLTTDIPTVFLEILRGRMTPASYLASLKGAKKDAVFSLEDPLPFLAELIMIPYLWMKRGF